MHIEEVYGFFYWAITRKCNHRRVKGTEQDRWNGYVGTCRICNVFGYPKPQIEDPMSIIWLLQGPNSGLWSCTSPLTLEAVKLQTFPLVKPSTLKWKIWYEDIGVLYAWPGYDQYHAVQETLIRDSGFRVCKFGDTHWTKIIELPPVGSPSKGLIWLPHKLGSFLSRKTAASLTWVRTSCQPSPRTLKKHQPLKPSLYG